MKNNLVLSFLIFFTVLGGLLITEIVRYGKQGIGWILDLFRSDKREVEN